MASLSTTLRQASRREDDPLNIVVVTLGGFPPGFALMPHRFYLLEGEVPDPCPPNLFYVGPGGPPSWTTPDLVLCLGRKAQYKACFAVADAFACPMVVYEWEGPGGPSRELATSNVFASDAVRDAWGLDGVVIEENLPPRLFADLWSAVFEAASAVYMPKRWSFAS